MNRHAAMTALLVASFIGAACTASDAEETSRSSTSDAPDASSSATPDRVTSPSTNPESVSGRPVRAPFAPLAIVDVNATGGGNLPVTDIESVLIDAEIVGMPIPNAGSLVWYRLDVERLDSTANGGETQHQSAFELSTQVTTDMAVTDIAQAYKAALADAGDFRFEDSGSATDTQELVAFETSEDTAHGLGRYIVEVRQQSRFTRAIQIEVTHITSPSTDEMRMPTGSAADEFAQPIDATAGGDLLLRRWSFRSGASTFADADSPHFVNAYYVVAVDGIDRTDALAGLRRTQDLFGAADNVEQTDSDFYRLEYNGNDGNDGHIAALTYTYGAWEIIWIRDRKVEG